MTRIGRIAAVANGHNGGRAKGYDAGWQEAAITIAAKRLAGLEVVCPKCGEPGTVLSKWVQGTPVKPVYVCHASGNGDLKACNLGKAEAAAARKEVGITRGDVLKLLRMGKSYVLFSGGKDSLCTLHYMKGLAQRAGRTITALHADTTAGFPEVERYVRKVCRTMGVELVTVRPPQDYFDLAKRWGIPGIRSRWCCETLKIAPIRRYLAGVDGPKVVFDGIRGAESNLRALYVPVWFHPSFRCISVSPIFAWSDGKIDQYIRRHGLPTSSVHKLGTSGECWCGAYKCKGDFESLLEVHPEIFDRLVEVEKAQKGRFTFIYEKGKRVALSSLKSAGNGRKRNTGRRPAR